MNNQQIPKTITRYDLFLNLQYQYGANNQFVLVKDGKELYDFKNDIIEYTCCQHSSHKHRGTPEEILLLKFRYPQPCVICFKHDPKFKGHVAQSSNKPKLNNVEDVVLKDTIDNDPIKLAKNEAIRKLDYERKMEKERKMDEIDGKADVMTLEEFNAKYQSVESFSAAEDEVATSAPIELDDSIKQLLNQPPSERSVSIDSVLEPIEEVAESIDILTYNKMNNINEEIPLMDLIDKEYLADLELGIVEDIDVVESIQVTRGKDGYFVPAATIEENSKTEDKNILFNEETNKNAIKESNLEAPAQSIDLDEEEDFEIAPYE
ncbi:MAG: hypothetical protein ACRC5M_06905 [Anaeroplasmataceae bacterium]